jgi:hypothetical protein
VSESAIAAADGSILLPFQIVVAVLGHRLAAIYFEADEVPMIWLAAGLALAIVRAECVGNTGTRLLLFRAAGRFAVGQSARAVFRD